ADPAPALPGGAHPTDGVGAALPVLLRSDHLLDLALEERGLRCGDRDDAGRPELIAHEAGHVEIARDAGVVPHQDRTPGAARRVGDHLPDAGALLRAELAGDPLITIL